LKINDQEDLLEMVNVNLSKQVASDQVDGKLEKAVATESAQALESSSSSSSNSSKTSKATTTTTTTTTTTKKYYTTSSSSSSKRQL